MPSRIIGRLSNCTRERGGNALSGAGVWNAYLEMTQSHHGVGWTPDEKSVVGIVDNMVVFSD
jgi:hypothetical protein